MIYSDKSAAEAIVRGLRAVERAHEEMDRYRSGPAPMYVEDNLRNALTMLGAGLRWSYELAEPERAE